MRRLLKGLAIIASLPAAAISLIIAANFPYHYDRPLNESEIKTAKKFYSEIYDTAKADSPDKVGVGVGEWAVGHFKIKEQVQQFVEDFNLGDKAVLEIGSGRGYLQDMVNDYTGLDISTNVARFYH